MKGDKILITRQEYLRLKEKNSELRKYLKIAIEEADGWYDETNGGKIPRSQNEDFYVARSMCDS